MDNRDTVYEHNNIPGSITRKLYIGYGIGKYNAGRIVIDDYMHVTTDFAAVTILEKEFTFELPKCKVDIQGKMLEVLEEEKQKILAENHSRLAAVQEKIDQLKSITYQSEKEITESGNG